eukprot:207557_1
MSQSQLFRVTSSSREFNGVMDFSFIVDKYDTYTKAQAIKSNEFAFGDLQLQVLCYPKGDRSTTRPGWISLFITALNGTENDKRQMHVSVTSDKNIIRRLGTQPVHKFALTWGWGNCFSYAQLQQCPIVRLRIKFEDNSDPPDTFVKQHHKMHELSQLHGDVTLVIKSPENNDYNSDDYLYSQPKKKRKLNDPYRCSVCNKEFQSEHGLKIHQSNKKDEAHM